MASNHLRIHRFYWLHRQLDRIANLRLLFLGRWVMVVSLALQAVILSLAGLLAYTDPSGQDLWPWLSPVLAWAHAKRFAIAFYLFLAQLILTALYWIGSESAWHDEKKLCRVLDAVADQIFLYPGHPDHTCRVTLFKARSCWFFGSWLGIVARSGRRYPKKTAVFCISPHTVTNNTGIVGECMWRAGQTILLRLPDCRNAKVSKKVQKNYMTEGFVDEREMGKLNVRSRVFLATGIRVAGELWGILVIDSTNPEELPHGKEGGDGETEYDGVLSFAAVAIEQLVS